MMLKALKLEVPLITPITWNQAGYGSLRILKPTEAGVPPGSLYLLASA